MPKWLVVTLSSIAVVALVAVAAVVIFRSSDGKSTVSTPTTVAVPQVAGTAVSAPTTSTTSPTVAPSAPTVPTAPATQTVTRTVTITPGTPATTAAPTTTTTVPAASGIGSVSIIDAPRVAGAPMDVIVRSVAEAQAALGTNVVPLWVAQFPFNQYALVLSTVAPSADVPSCHVPDEVWSRNGAALTILQRVLCYGGTDFSTDPGYTFDPNQRRVAALALPLTTVSGVTTIVRT